MPFRSSAALTAAISMAATTAIAFASHAGPTPDYCDFEPLGCWLDKKCQVGDSEPQDSCTAFAGDEVTYYYSVETFPYESALLIEDDQLGEIDFANSTSNTLTRTVTLTETTTNTATVTSLGICPCVGGVLSDSVTVTVTTPSQCMIDNPVTAIVTVGKGQSPANNAKLSHLITGHIVDPGSLGPTAHRIGVCAGTSVTAVVQDATGSPTITSEGSLACDASGCSGVVDVTEKYLSVSQDGKDRDSITFLPR